MLLTPGSLFGTTAFKRDYTPPGAKWKVPMVDVFLRVALAGSTVEEWRQGLEDWKQFQLRVYRKYRVV